MGAFLFGSHNEPNIELNRLTTGKSIATMPASGPEYFSALSVVAKTGSVMGTQPGNLPEGR
jgi:hypothetical protein